METSRSRREGRLDSCAGWEEPSLGTSLLAGEGCGQELGQNSGAGSGKAPGWPSERATTDEGCFLAKGRQRGSPLSWLHFMNSANICQALASTSGSCGWLDPLGWSSSVGVASVRRKSGGSVAPSLGGLMVERSRPSGNMEQGEGLSGEIFWKMQEVSSLGGSGGPGGLG